MSDTLDILTTIITEKFNGDAGAGADTKLREAGLDSLDTINFLFSVEEETGVNIPDEALVEEPLETLGQLAEYVDRNKG